MAKIFVQENEYKKKDTQPTHRIFLIPDVEEDGEEDQEWPQIGALWLTKSGRGWSGSLSDGVEIKLTKQFYDNQREYQSKRRKRNSDAGRDYQKKRKGNTTEIEYPEEIDPNDIPF